MLFPMLRILGQGFISERKPLILLPIKSMNIL
jgi:hypothetical protein